MENNCNNFSNNKHPFSNNAHYNNFASFIVNDIQDNNNKIKEEYLINLEGLIRENENYKELIEKIKNENFRLNNQINLHVIEKQDFSNQIKKQEEKENNLHKQIFEYENTFKMFKQKEEHFNRLSDEYFNKEAEKINLINIKNSQIENLQTDIKNLNKTIEEKDKVILLKANEINNIYQIKSEYEGKIVNLANENQREKDKNRELLLKLEILNSDFNLKLQLNQNQINHLNENINQLNNEIILNKENFLFQIQSLENKLSENKIEKDLLKSQNEILNSQISTLNKSLQLKEAESEEKNSNLNNMQKTISKLNQEIQIFSETISERDMEISKIYKYKEKFDKYTYIEKNLDVFSVINAADLFTLQNEFKKLYSINKENKNQLENLNSINEKLRNDSQNLSLLKENFIKIENELNKYKKEYMELVLKQCEIQNKNEDLNNEVFLLRELKNRVSEQNKRLLLDAKLLNSNFNILNSSIDKNKKDYENFLYNNIEDLESKNSDLHYFNIKINKELTREKEICLKSKEELKIKETIIKEQKDYIDNLEQNLKEVNNKISSISYYKQFGFGGHNIAGIPSSLQEQNINSLYEEMEKLNSKNTENKIIIDDLNSKVNLYEKQNEDYKSQMSSINQELLKLKNEKHLLNSEINNYRNQFTTNNLKISNLENQILIKDNFLNATNYENMELRKNLENLRIQKETIFEEISNTSKEAINKLNENKQIFLEQIDKLLNENKLLKNTIDKYNEYLNSIIPNTPHNTDNNTKNTEDYNKSNVIMQTENEKKINNDNSSKNYLFNESLLNNFTGLNNLLNLLDEKDKEILFNNNNFNKENFFNINQKFEILKKILLLADKSINNNFDNKIKFDNLNTIIYNLRFKIEIYESRINHLENLLKSLSEIKDKTDLNLNNKIKDKNYMEIEFNYNTNKGTSKKLKEPQIKILQSSLITSSSEMININNINETNTQKEFLNKNILENRKQLNETYKISFMENTEFLKNYFEVLRQNDNYRIVNMELNAQITEIKKQNEELINKKFDSGISTSNTSKFFFEKYNGLLVEKVNLENIISNDKREIENLHLEISKLNKEISNLKIEKKDMENLFNNLEKKFNEESENNIKTQEKLMKQIDDLNINLQSLQKDKSNFNNVFNKIRADKINLENINKNNLTEITNLKENILHKDELINNLRNEIENLNNKILELNQIKIDLENKLKSAGESKNNIWVKKLITILYRSKGIIEIFIQLKNSLEEKIKNYENSFNANINNNIININNNVLSSKQGETIISNNIFINAVNELNSKMLKYDQEFKIHKKKEEAYEKKIAQLNNELSLLQEKEKIVGNDYKVLKDAASGEQEQNKPAGTGQEIKIYFSKMVQHINTARNIINFKDGIIKKLENEINILNGKLNEEKLNLNNITINGCSKCNLIITQNKKLIDVNASLSKNLQDEIKDKNEMVTKNRNTLIENITLTKDINGIVKYISEQEKSDKISLDSSGQMQNNIQIENNKKLNEITTNISDTPPIVNANLEKARKDFSSLLILMRKASRLINVFDNKVKIVANKLSQ